MTRERLIWRIDWRKLLIVAVLTVGALLMVLPYYWMVISSLKPPEELYTYPPRFYVLKPTVAPYTELFTLLPMARSLLNSFFVEIGRAHV